MPADLILVPNDFLHSQQLFANEKQKLQKILADFNLEIIHFGSTSVPGTIGKGIIDIMIACNSMLDQQNIKELLIQHHYRQGELNKKPDGRLFFSNGQGQTQAGDIHLHVVLKNSVDWVNAVRLHDYLIHHPEEVIAYNQEKLRLAKITNNDRKEYVTLKGEFIQNLLHH